MIKPEEFKAIVEQIEAGIVLSVEEATKLVDTIKHMDVQLMIAQNALQLSIQNLAIIVPHIASDVLAKAGRTDQKIKKKIAELAAQAVANCEDSVQTYLINSSLEAVKMFNLALDEFIAQPETQEDPYAGEAPHNHD